MFPKTAQYICTNNFQKRKKENASSESVLLIHYICGKSYSAGNLVGTETS